MEMNSKGLVCTLDVGSRKAVLQNSLIYKKHVLVCFHDGASVSSELFNNWKDATNAADCFLYEKKQKSHKKKQKTVNRHDFNDAKTERGRMKNIVCGENTNETQ